MRFIELQQWGYSGGKPCYTPVLINPQNITAIQVASTFSNIPKDENPCYRTEIFYGEHGIINVLESIEAVRHALEHIDIMIETVFPDKQTLKNLNDYKQP